MSEARCCNSCVLDECLQYIIHEACGKLVKSHLSRSGMFLDLTQSYIYYLNLIYPTEQVLYYCFCLVTKVKPASEMLFVSNIPHMVDTVHYTGSSA
jgi:hypothetical protein